LLFVILNLEQLFFKHPELSWKNWCSI